MVSTPPWETTTPEPTYAESKVDPDALALAEVLATFIRLGANMDARSQQVAIGSSEVGWPCDRRVVYRLNGVPKSNRGMDPLRRLIGTGLHAALADLFRRIDPGGEAFAVETAVRYLNVPGTADLVYNGTVIDWKSTTTKKIAMLKREGPPRHYVVQANLYAAGLRARGEDITHVALCFIPIDADHRNGLKNLWVWRAPFNQAIADDAVERLGRLVGKRPSEVEPKPDRLCAYCSHYDPHTTDLDVGCPGQEKGS